MNGKVYLLRNLFLCAGLALYLAAQAGGRSDAQERSRYQTAPAFVLACTVPFCSYSHGCISGQHLATRNRLAERPANAGPVPGNVPRAGTDRCAHAYFRKNATGGVRQMAGHKNRRWLGCGFSGKFFTHKRCNG